MGLYNKGHSVREASFTWQRYGNNEAQKLANAGRMSSPLFRHLSATSQSRPPPSGIRLTHCSKKLEQPPPLVVQIMNHKP